MSVKADLIALIEKVSHSCELPAVKEVYLPEPQPGPDRHTEFGLVILNDDSAGLYYAWLGEEQSVVNKRFAADKLVGQSPLDLARYFENEHEADRSLGLAAVNAITQSVFRQAKYVPEIAGNSLGALDISPGDHVGMVGYFPSLVRRLGERRLKLTVIEKKSQFAEKNELLEVTQDLQKLRGCDKIMVTASTLLNDSIDQVLDHTGDAETVVVIGPTAGFFPDPLFKRGVSAVGGSSISNPDIAIEQLENDRGLADIARKYLISCDNYPGVEKLLR